MNGGSEANVDAASIFKEQINPNVLAYETLAGR